MCTTVKRVLILLILCSVGLSLQCAKNFMSSTGNGLSALTPAEKALVNSGNKFGFKLFREIMTRERGKNVFISPLGASMALGMTYNGANGSTREAMASTLELTGLTVQEANESYQHLIDALTNLDPTVQFQLANSIWYRQEYTFEAAFINLNKTYFNAAVRGLDFNSPTAKEIIDGWVNEQTHGKIDKIVGEINPLTVMFLINALYFKGSWTYEFDKALTRDDWFTGLDGLPRPCKMMAQGGEFAYFANADFQAIDLPYGDQKFSMTILLPTPGTSLDTFIGSFTRENWDQWMQNLTKQKGNVYLPKFTLRYEHQPNWNGLLQALGMGIAFSDQADFTNIYKPGGIAISQVKQKTFVDVNEEGTEAAAVTVVEVGVVSATGPRLDFVMRIDRPFVFVIRERQSQTILFMGKLVEPITS